MKRLATQRILLSIMTLIAMLAAHANSRNYQVEDGLSYNSVWCVCQDSKGFLWLGTNDGLNRFDGQNFKVYQNHPNIAHSLGNNFIHAIEELADGRLLIGTRRGIYLYNRTMDNFTPVSLGKQYDKEVSINDIKEDHNGNVWVATHGNGLFCLDSQLQQKAHFVKGNSKGALSSDFLWTLAVDSHDNLWIGTAGYGFSLYNAHARNFINYGTWGDKDLSGQAIYSIAPDQDGSLWIGTSSLGLLHCQPSTNGVEQYLPTAQNVKAIKHYRGQQLIMGTEKGVVLFDKKSCQQQPIAGISGHEDNFVSVFDIEPDASGGIWVGTYFNGLNYLSAPDGASIRQVMMNSTAAYRQTVSTFAELPHGEIVFCTHNDKFLYQYHPTDGTVSKLLTLSHENVQDMLVHKGNLYIGMAGNGIDVYSLPDLHYTRHIKHNIAEGQSLFALPGGALVLALEEGGALYDDGTGDSRHLKQLEHNMVSGVVQDGQGRLWFSTYNNGLFIWSKDGKWQNLTTINQQQTSTSLYGLTSITYANGSIWVGTKEHGIMGIVPDKLHVHLQIDESAGLFSNTVYALTHDAQGNIWASTKDNIVRMNGKSHALQFIGRQRKNNPTNIHRVFTASDGQLFFAGTRGFYVVNPQQLKEKHHQEPLRLTRLIVNYQEVRPDKEGSPLKESIESTGRVVLSNSQNNFSVEFALLDFKAPEENIYRYRMEGLDKGWIYSMHPAANYMNLPTGRYVFVVSGSSGDGTWSEERRLEVVIKPPFWRSTGMLITYVLSAILLTIVAIWYYNRYLRQQQEKRQQQFQIAQERELYEQKISFFTNIAHEIRTPLSLISGPVENILRKQDLTEATRHNMETIQRNTNRLLTLVSQLLDFRKIENDMFQLNIRYQNMQGIVQRVCEQYMPEAEANNIKVEVSMPSEGVLGFVDAEALYKIVSNLLSNALKFCRSRIDITLKVKESTALLTVSDDGRGIREEDRRNIFEPFYQADSAVDQSRGTGLGLSLSKSLALKMNGDLTIATPQAGGACFVLTLPAMNAYHVLPQAANDSAATVERTDEEKSTPSILIVEDNKDLADFIAETLQDAYAILKAKNGLEALSLVESSDVDIIISDVMMPVMDGLELCDRLRNSHDYSHLPIILLSAKTDTETKVKGIRQGADAYIEKPFSVEQLRAQIETILQKRAQVQQRVIESPLDYYRKAPQTDDQAAFIEKLNSMIIEHMSDRDFNVETLVKAFATNRTNFQKKLKSITGLTPNDYIRLIRLNKSAELLATGRYRINEVCAIVGFNSPSYFSKCFNEQFGRLPKDFVQTT